MNGREIVDRIRIKNALAPDSPVGVVGCFAKSAKIEGDGRTVRAIATTDDIDCDMEVVVPEGADLGYFVQNRGIFIDHRMDYAHCCGKLRDVKLFVRPDTGRSGFEVRVYCNTSPAGEAVLAMAREQGTGWSIGFEARDRGRPTADEETRYARGGKVPRSVVRGWEWLELSATMFPCNVACQTGETVVDDRNKALLDEMVTKGRMSRESAALLGLAEAAPGPLRVRVC